MARSTARPSYAAWALRALVSWLAAHAWSSPAFALTRVHALVIASNVASASGAAPEELPELRYADDDAAAFHDLLEPIAASTELLTVLDAQSQALFPELGARTRPPTLDGVRAAVSRLRARIHAERALGYESSVFVFFSGHGSLGEDGRPALRLLDGGLTRDFLYDEVLAALPADELHLLIDACHAEAVVRPRGARAEVVSVSPQSAQAFLVQSTLARFPHVGAIMAATSDSRAHEWDRLGHGIFTYELLSALRGAADVNRDRRIEYSEVYAFMSAANREIEPHARLRVVAKPPALDRRAALLTLSQFPDAQSAWLSGVPGSSGIVEISDARGRRLITLHGDSETFADLLVPAGSTLFVRGPAGEAEFAARQGEVVPFERLEFGSAASRERGALDDAIRRGLFKAEYGRSYYAGVVDQKSGFISVEFDAARDQRATRYPRAAIAARDGYRLVLGAGLSSGVAELVPITHGVSVGLRPDDEAGVLASLRVLRASDGRLEEWRTQGSVGWVWPAAYGRVRGWAGAAFGGGVFTQVVEGGTARHSGALTLGPLIALTVDVAGQLGLWSEVELSGVLYRKDDRTTFSLFPSAWLGASLRF